jgi:hypothetical protein
VDDCLLFWKWQCEINAVIDKKKADGFSHTVKDNVFAFLGVEIIKDKMSGKIELRKVGLIEKTLRSCKMSNCNRMATLSKYNTSGDGCKKWRKV